MIKKSRSWPVSDITDAQAVNGIFVMVFFILPYAIKLWQKADGVIFSYFLNILQKYPGSE